MEKKLSKKDKKKNNSSLFKKKKKEALPSLENPERDEGTDGAESSTNATPVGSVISIQQAHSDDTANNTEQDARPSTSQRAASARPKSAAPSRPRTARRNLDQALQKQEQKDAAASDDASSTRTDQMASMTSLRSKEAWTDVDKTPTPSNQGSLISVKECSPDPSAADKPLSKWLPSDMNEAHAYVPYLYARDLIGKMMDDMRKMKKKHFTIVTDVENNYQNIEEKTQSMFNNFVLTLRGGYGNKVKTFRQVIEVHRLELSQKQQYWDEALQSLSDRNKGLLEDKKKLLIQNKLEFERLEKEKDELKEELTRQMDDSSRRLDTNSKDLIQRLEESKADNEDLRRQLEERPTRTLSQGTLQEAAPIVAVTDLSEKERARMDHERKDMQHERKQIHDERKAIDREVSQLGTQRDDLQGKMKELQDQLNEQTKESESWKAKYEEMKRTMELQGDLPAQHAQLQAQYTALAQVAKPEPEQCQEALQKTEDDRTMMKEEKEKLEKDVEKWEEDFKEKNNREPTEEEKGESHKSLDEAKEMIDRLNTQVATLEAMKEGTVPEPPQPQPLPIPEPEIKIVEVRVPDPEVVAMLQMTQAELEAMCKAMRATRNEKSALQSRVTKLEGELSESQRESARSEAANRALQDQIRELQTLAAAAAGGDGANTEELRKIIREKDKEIRDQELEYKEALREAEKERKSLEKDLTKALKKLQKALKKQGDPAKEARLNRLLQVVAAQVKDIHSSNSKASKEVENRLKEAENNKSKTTTEQGTAQEEYTAWAQEYEDENGAAPKAEDRENSSKGERVYERKKDAEYEAEEADLLETALQLIATGAVPEEEKEEAESQTAAGVKKRVGGRIVEEREWEEVEVKMDEKISQHEEKIVYLEDKITDLQSEKDVLINNSKDMEDRTEELERQIKKLEGEAEQLKDKQQELQLDLKEQSAQHSLSLTEKDREHVSIVEQKDKQHKEEKKDMEKDIAKLVKLIDKLKKKLGRLEKDSPLSAEEKAEEDIEDKLTDMESQVAELRAEKKQLEADNWELEEKVTTTERLLTTVESRTVELGAAAEAASANAADLAQARDELEQLRAKIKELEEEIREREKDMREKQVEHEKEIREKEREKKEMTNDIAKLVKLVNKLKKKVKALKGKDDGEGDTDDTDDLEVKVVELEADKNHLTDSNKELEDKVEELSRDLAAAEAQIADLRVDADAKAQLDATNEELQALRKRITDLENDLRGTEKLVKDKDIEIRDAQNEHDRQIREKEKEERDMRADIKKMLKEMAKLKKKLKMREGPDMAPVAEAEEDKEKELAALEDSNRQLEDMLADLKGAQAKVQRDAEALTTENKNLASKLSALEDEVDRLRQRPVTPHTGQQHGDLQDLMKQMDALQKDVDRAEGELREERMSHDITREELEALKRQLVAMVADVNTQKEAAQATIDKAKLEHTAEVGNLSRKMEEAKTRVTELEDEKQKKLPPDAAAEIKKYQEKMAVSEKERDALEINSASTAAELRELRGKVTKLESSSKAQRTNNNDAENKLRKLRQEKDKEIKRLEAQMDKKVQQRQDQEKKKIAALEQQVKELKWNAGGSEKQGKAAAGGADPRALKVVQDKLAAAHQEKEELNKRLKDVNADLKAASKGGGGGGADMLKVKKLEKQNADLNKKLEMEQKKNEKNTENLKKKDEDVKALAKEVTVKDHELQKLRMELKALGSSAKEAEEKAQQAKELKTEVKKLAEENKTLGENFNSERVLRKKYYNMVEDMKGKIRVYARARPLSKLETGNGNKNICKSPDEYTINVASSRGLKEFQFDQIFMPETTQEKVFEDTNALIQSAVDGFNVCIFAYGQTGSGKTFTIIGDKEQNHPGIAPRAFTRIFDLINENRQKFSCRVNCYMLELYNDKLLDLFVRQGAAQEDKLEIKKDKKGLVYVHGAEVKQARNSKELMGLFEDGSERRHVASHRMNAESSRSHLVIGILIESTNKATGQVTKGKLSLVDLAGSERAAKTGASADQLKEAMSINKSLSALGDVISALSSEQQFIPYRNNKLTMLMQDSLGGNAKTLMFVNVSPADYNGDETVISLTYASRVKLITNDAQKNADNREIARLRAIIAKLKKGEQVEEELD